MAETKKIVINRGPRTFKLKNAPDGSPRELGPGQSIEVADDAEYKFLMRFFREVVDADKAVPANEQRVKAMQAQIDKLKSENSKLAGPEKEEPAVHKSDAPKHKPEASVRKKGK